MTLPAIAIELSPAEARNLLLLLNLVLRAFPTASADAVAETERLATQLLPLSDAALAAPVTALQQLIEQRFPDASAILARMQPRASAPTVWH